jgi:hypothetical protein
MSLICYFCFFVFGFTSLCADSLYVKEEKLEKNEESLFVSLGSFCEPAHMLRFCELRKKAYPFDWIVSMDGEALIEMLEDGFEKFLKDEYFVPFGPAGHLLHTHYHLEFLHDGDFNQQFAEKLEKLKHKYQTRIDRFKSLENYPYKVYFVRNAYIFSMTDPHRFYKFHSNLEISEEFSQRLYKALQFIFPTLNFDLLIINCGDEESIVEQKKIGDHLRIFKGNPHWEPSKKIENYNLFFNQIINEGSKLLDANTTEI